MRTLKIEVCWDEEALVWYVAESDVPGLNAEAETVDEVLSKLRDLVPMLLEVNAHLLGNELPQGEAPSICINAHKLERFALA